MSDNLKYCINNLNKNYCKLKDMIYNDLELNIDEMPCLTNMLNKEKNNYLDLIVPCKMNEEQLKIFNLSHNLHELQRKYDILYDYYIQNIYKKYNYYL